MARTKKKVQDEQRLELARYMAMRARGGKVGRGRPRVKAPVQPREATPSTSSSYTQPSVISQSQHIGVSGLNLLSIPSASLGTTTQVESSVRNSVEIKPEMPRQPTPLPSTANRTSPSKATARKSTTKTSNTKTLHSGNNIKCTSNDGRNRDMGNIFDKMLNKNSPKKLHTKTSVNTIELKRRIQVFRNLQECFNSLNYSGKKQQIPVVCLNDISNLLYPSNLNRRSCLTAMGSTGNAFPGFSLQGKNSHSKSVHKEKTSQERLQESDRVYNTTTSTTNHNSSHTATHSLKNEQSEIKIQITPDDKGDRKRLDVSLLAPNICKQEKNVICQTVVPLTSETNSQTPVRSVKRKRSPNVRLGNDMILWPWYSSKRSREKGTNNSQEKKSSLPSSLSKPIKVEDSKTINDINLICNEQMPSEENLTGFSNISKDSQSTAKRSMDFSIPQLIGNTPTVPQDDILFSKDDISESMSITSALDMSVQVSKATDMKVNSRLCNLIDQISTRVDVTQETSEVWLSDTSDGSNSPVSNSLQTSTDELLDSTSASSNFTSQDSVRTNDSVCDSNESTLDRLEKEVQKTTLPDLGHDQIENTDEVMTGVDFDNENTDKILDDKKAQNQSVSISIKKEALDTLICPFEDRKLNLNTTIKLEKADNVIEENGSPITDYPETEISSSVHDDKQVLFAEPTVASDSGENSLSNLDKFSMTSQEDDLLYGQRTREPAPLSVLSTVECEKAPQTLSAFMSANLDSYLQSDDNRKIVFSKTGKKSTITNVKKESPGEGSSPVVNPDFDDVDGMLFVSFPCKDSMNAHISIESQNHWDDNNLHFLDMCKFHQIDKLKKQHGISGKLPKSLRKSDHERNYRGIHMKWFKYVRLFKKEMHTLKGKSLHKRNAGKKKLDSQILTSDVQSQEELEGPLSESLPLQQSGKLHWRTEQRLLRSLQPSDIKEMGLELKKKRRKNMIFTHRKGSSSKFEGRIGRSGRIQRSTFDQDYEYYFGDRPKSNNRGEQKTSVDHPHTVGKTEQFQKKFNMKKQLMKKYNLCGVKKLKKMWKCRIQEGKLLICNKMSASVEFPILTESMVLHAVTALEYDKLSSLPRGEEATKQSEDGTVHCDKPGCRYGCVCHLFIDRSIPVPKPTGCIEAATPTVSRTCEKEYCRLGCICSSLERSPVQKSDHCGKPDCMFGCVCEELPPSMDTSDECPMLLSNSSPPDIPQLQAVISPEENKLSDTSPPPVPSISQPSKEVKKPRSTQSKNELPIRVGSRRVAKNLDAVTRKALMYMDPDDIFTKPKRRRSKKTDEVPEISRMDLPTRPKKSGYTGKSLPYHVDTDTYTSCARTTPMFYTYRERMAKLKEKGGNPVIPPVPLPSREGKEIIPVISISDEDIDILQKTGEKKTTKKKERSRKQKLEKTLSDSPLKGNHRQVVPTKAPTITSEPRLCVRDKWSTHMVCLQPNKPSQPELSKDKQTPHLLEFIFNCPWENSRTAILGVVARLLVPSAHPLPSHFTVGELTIEIMPKASKPAKIPENLRSTFPKNVFPVRVRISPTWFFNQQKTKEESQISENIQDSISSMTASKRLSMKRQVQSAQGTAAESVQLYNGPGIKSAQEKVIRHPSKDFSGQSSTSESLPISGSSSVTSAQRKVLEVHPSAEGSDFESVQVDVGLKSGQERLTKTYRKDQSTCGSASDSVRIAGSAVLNNEKELKSLWSNSSGISGLSRINIKHSTQQACTSMEQTRATFRLHEGQVTFKGSNPDLVSPARTEVQKQNAIEKTDGISPSVKTTTPVYQSFVKSTLANPTSGSNNSVKGTLANPTSGSNNSVNGTLANPTSGSNNSVKSTLANSTSGSNNSVNGTLANPTSGSNNSVNGTLANPTSGSNNSVKGTLANPTSVSNNSAKGTLANSTSGSNNSVKGTLANPTSVSNNSVKGTLANSTSGSNNSVKGTLANPTSGSNNSVKGTLANQTSVSNNSVKGTLANPISGSNNSVKGTLANPTCGSINSTSSTITTQSLPQMRLVQDPTKGYAQLLRASPSSSLPMLRLLPVKSDTASPHTHNLPSHDGKLGTNSCDYLAIPFVLSGSTNNEQSVNSSNPSPETLLSKELTSQSVSLISKSSLDDFISKSETDKIQSTETDNIRISVTNNITGMEIADTSKSETAHPEKNTSTIIKIENIIVQNEKLLGSKINQIPTNDPNKASSAKDKTTVELGCDITNKTDGTTFKTNLAPKNETKHTSDIENDGSSANETSTTISTVENPVKLSPGTLKGSSLNQLIDGDMRQQCSTSSVKTEPNSSHVNTLVTSENSSDKPCDSSDRPRYSSEQPHECSDRPYDSSEQPWDCSDRPFDSSDRPSVQSSMSSQDERLVSNLNGESHFEKVTTDPPTDGLTSLEKDLQLVTSDESPLPSTPMEQETSSLYALGSNPETFSTEDRLPLLKKHLTNTQQAKGSEEESSLGSWSENSEQNLSENGKCEEVLTVSSSDDEDSEALIDVEELSDREMGQEKHRSKRKSSLPPSYSNSTDMTFTEYNKASIAMAKIIVEEYKLLQSKLARPLTQRPVIAYKKNKSLKDILMVFIGHPVQSLRRPRILHQQRERERRSDLRSSFRNLRQTISGKHPGNELPKVKILSQAKTLISNLENDVLLQESLLLDQKQRHAFLQKKLQDISGALSGNSSTITEDGQFLKVGYNHTHSTGLATKKFVETITRSLECSGEEDPVISHNIKSESLSSNYSADHSGNSAIVLSSSSSDEDNCDSESVQPVETGSVLAHTHPAQQSSPTGGKSELEIVDDRSGILEIGPEGSVLIQPTDDSNLRISEVCSLVELPPSPEV